MRKMLMLFLGLSLWNCFGGSEDEAVQTPGATTEIPKDGYYYHSKYELFRLINYQYFGFFGGNKVEILELGFDESDSQNKVLKRIEKLRYDILSSTSDLRFKLKEGRDTTAEIELKLDWACPFRLNPIGNGAIRSMTLRNPTDSTIEVLVLTDWRTDPKVDIESLIGACASKN